MRGWLPQKGQHMKNENEAEGGFTAIEMRTDYARSHVWPGWARDLEALRSAELVTMSDILENRAKAIEAGDRKTADLLRRAATYIIELEDKQSEHRRMLREDADALKAAAREIHDARKALADAAQGRAVL